MAFITVHDWKIRDIGLTQFDGLPETGGLASLSYAGEATSKPEGSYTGIHYITRSDHTGGTTGVVTTYSRYGVISAVLNLENRSSTWREDRKRLSTLLCPGCYEAVLKATEELDCFLLDCGRLEVYSLESPGREFQIGTYDFQVPFTTPTDLVFLGFTQAMS